MNRQYQHKVSLKNYNQLLSNLQNMSGDYVFLPHPVDKPVFQKLTDIYTRTVCAF